MKAYNALNWYWIVAGDTARVYSSDAHDYVPSSDAVYQAWLADDALPTIIDTEYNLGAVLFPYFLRPIPSGILVGYLDAQIASLVRQPDFKLWLDAYSQIIHPAPTEAQIMARIRSKL